MQQLYEELTNTPGNASQVPCSVSEALNKEETLSVSCKVLRYNNSEENLLVWEVPEQNFTVSVTKTFPLLTKEHDYQLLLKLVYMYHTSKDVCFHGTNKKCIKQYSLTETER